MEKQKSRVYTGNPNGGSPYIGGLDRGINYDTDEIERDFIEQQGNFPKIVNGYRMNARKLISHLSTNKGDVILDIGSGTGISTLELFSQNPYLRVVGLEISKGMLEVAKYKFHQTNGKDLLKQVDNQKLKDYWNEFKGESKPHKDKVKFILGNIEKTKKITPKSIDNAIANQVMHWTDLSTSFKQLNKFLKTKGELIWSSASHFYNDSQFPSAEYGFRYHDFLGFVMDEVAKKVEVKDYKSLSKPEYNLESIQNITAKQGFKTEHIATNREFVDFQIFLKTHLPVLAKTLITSKINDKRKENIIKQAIAKTIINPKALTDTTHKYDIVPIFRSIKTP